MQRGGRGGGPRQILLPERGAHPSGITPPTPRLRGSGAGDAPVTVAPPPCPGRGPHMKISTLPLSIATWHGEGVVTGGDEGGGGGVMPTRQEGGVARRPGRAAPRREAPQPSLQAAQRQRSRARPIAHARPPAQSLPITPPLWPALAVQSENKQSDAARPPPPQGPTGSSTENLRSGLTIAARSPGDRSMMSIAWRRGGGSWGRGPWGWGFLRSAPWGACR